MLLNEVEHCCLIFHGIVTHCMVLRGIVRYFMALCCINTIEMILRDRIHSEFGQLLEQISRFLKRKRIRIDKTNNNLLLQMIGHSTIEQH